MATALRSTNVPTEENQAPLMMKDAKAGLVKGSSLLQQGSKRRAPLCDVSNIAGPLSTRNAQGKDDKAAKGVVKKPPSDAKPPSSGNGLIPRTRSQTLAARRQGSLDGKGMSMSTMLETRSVAASHSTLPDIDHCDLGNCLAVADYVNDIYQFYRRVEPKFQVDPEYMSRQTDINEKMRAILLDWLVEVHHKFKLMPETLYLTVNLIDRFLELRQTTRKELQLVGVTAMLISSKYEEIWAPEVRDFVYISDKAYTRDQILNMEKNVLNALKFNLTLPTPYIFQARFLKAAGVASEKPISFLSSYLLELALIERHMLCYSPSTTAAASTLVALTAHGKADTYPEALEKHSGYSRSTVLPCAAALVKLMQQAPSASLTSVYKKYSHSKYLEVSRVPAPAQILEEAEGLIQ